MLPQRSTCPDQACIRAGYLLRYLVHMNRLGFWTLLLMGATTWPALAQTSAPLALGDQGGEGGAAPGALLVLAVKPVAGNNLRSILQLQKARLQETQPPERHLSSQERTELRKQLRQQRETAAVSH